jgi:hypothetical protein
LGARHDEVIVSLSRSAMPVWGAVTTRDLLLEMRHLMAGHERIADGEPYDVNGDGRSNAGDFLAIVMRLGRRCGRESHEDRRSHDD